MRPRNPRPVLAGLDFDHHFPMTDCCAVCWTRWRGELFEAVTKADDPIPSGVRVWLAVGRTDMRRGMNSLAPPCLVTIHHKAARAGSNFGRGSGRSRDRPPEPNSPAKGPSAMPGRRAWTSRLHRFALGDWRRFVSHDGGAQRRGQNGADQYAGLGESHVSSLMKRLIRHQNRNGISHSAETRSPNEIAQRRVIGPARRSRFYGEQRGQRYPERLADYQSQNDAEQYSPGVRRRQIETEADARGKATQRTRANGSARQARQSQRRLPAARPVRNPSGRKWPGSAQKECRRRRRAQRRKHAIRRAPASLEGQGCQA